MLSKVWAIRTPPAAKVVLICLADLANDRGRCCLPQSVICRHTCYGRTAVVAALRWLKATGFVSSRSLGPGRGNEYRLRLPQRVV
jgi:GTP-sensing pleiotropic transcriptional regulator CodY